MLTRLLLPAISFENKVVSRKSFVEEGEEHKVEECSGLVKGIPLPCIFEHRVGNILDIAVL